MGEALAMAGLLVGILGGIWLLGQAFGESFGWGLASFLLPLVIYFFVYKHWPKSKTPFLISMVGTVLVLVAVAMGEPIPFMDG